MVPYQQKISPVFSVIITCYNDGDFIDEAIQSVLNSTFNNFEIILVDDCSTDKDTIEKLNILENAGFPVMRKKVNAGVGDSRNRGIENSKGKYILTLDADDRILPGYLEKSLIYLEKGFTVVYCNVKRFGITNSIISVPEFSFELLLAGNFIVNCSPFTRNIWEKTGGFDTQMKNYEDWEFWIRVSEKGGAFYHLNEVLFEYRAKPVSLNNQCANPDYRAEVVRYVCRKHETSYQKYITDIVPYLHKVISSLEADNLKMVNFKRSFFWKLKSAADKFRPK